MASVHETSARTSEGSIPSIDMMFDRERKVRLSQDYIKNAYDYLLPRAWAICDQPVDEDHDDRIRLRIVAKSNSRTYVTAGGKSVDLSLCIQQMPQTALKDETRTRDVIGLRYKFQDFESDPVISLHSYDIYLTPGIIPLITERHDAPEDLYSLFVALQLFDDSIEIPDGLIEVGKQSN